MKPPLNKLLLIFILLANTAHAQKDLRYLRHGWWGSAGIGSGFLKTTFTQDTAQRAGKFGITAKGGYAINQYLLTGVEVSGWNLTKRPFLSFDGNKLPASGANDMLMNTAFLIQTYPTRLPVYLKASMGWTFYMPTAKNKYQGSGFGYSLGTGYEYIVNKMFGLGLFVNYDFGKLKDKLVENNQYLANRKYDVINLGVNFTIY